MRPKSQPVPLEPLDIPTEPVETPPEPSPEDDVQMPLPTLHEDRVLSPTSPKKHKWHFFGGHHKKEKKSKEEKKRLKEEQKKEKKEKKRRKKEMKLKGEKEKDDVDSPDALLSENGRFLVR